MKRVINKGYEKFTATCDKCNCTFEYDLEDVHHPSPEVYCVRCPVCDYVSDHLSNVQHMRKVDAFIDDFHRGE